MTFEQAAIEAFRSGPIVHSDLDPNGISFLSVDVAGSRVTASWYDGFLDRPRDIRVNGRAYPSGGHDIIRTAMRRASGLLNEEMAKLDESVATAR